MLKALQLLLIPGTAWNRIVESKRGMASVVLISLLPLLVVVAAAEGYALQHWGLQGASSGQASALPQHLVVRFESIQFGLSLLVVFLGASMIRWLSDSFHFYPKFIRCFIVAAYGLSPIFVFRLLNCLPVMNIWISFALGVLGVFTCCIKVSALCLNRSRPKDSACICSPRSFSPCSARCSISST